MLGIIAGSKAQHQTLAPPGQLEAVNSLRARFSEAKQYVDAAALEAHHLQALLQALPAASARAGPEARGMQDSDQFGLQLGQWGLILRAHQLLVSAKDPFPWQDQAG